MFNVSFDTDDCEDGMNLSIEEDSVLFRGDRLSPEPLPLVLCDCTAVAVEVLFVVAVWLELTAVSVVYFSLNSVDSDMCLEKLSVDVDRLCFGLVSVRPFDPSSFSLLKVEPRVCLGGLCEMLVMFLLGANGDKGAGAKIDAMLGRPCCSLL